MNKNYPFSEIQRLIGPAKDLLICLPKNASFDQVAAGLTLYLLFSGNNRTASILAPDPMTVGLSHLVGLDKIKTKLESRNLILTINVPLESIDKVTSDDVGQHLRLVVIPKEGFPAITREQVLFSSTQKDTDLILTVGVPKFESLAQIYQDNQELFRQKPIINLDNNSQNTGFGRLNIVDPTAASICEIVVSIINGLSFALTEDMAANLLQGLRSATNNFQDPKVTAATFEAAAWCLKATGNQTTLPEEKLDDAPSQPAPSDWLEPKIYKGSTLA